MVGATCRLDAVELMEKRVRSRFSHEKQLVLPPQAGAEDPLDTPQALLAALMRLPPDVGAGQAFVENFNRSVEDAVAGAAVQGPLQLAAMRGEV